MIRFKDKFSGRDWYMFDASKYKVSGDIEVLRPLWDFNKLLNFYRSKFND